MVVSRVGKEQRRRQPDPSQVFSSPRSLAHRRRRDSACSALIPGMPHLVFLMPAGSAGGAWLMREQQRRRSQSAPKPPPAPPEANAEASWEDLHAGRHARPRGRLPADRAGRQGQAAATCSAASRACASKFAQDVGFLPPPVHIRDNLELKPSAYRLSTARRDRRRRRGLPGHVAGDQPGRRDAAADRHRHHRPGVRPARHLDRGTPARAGADGRIYGR